MKQASKNKIVKKVSGHVEVKESTIDDLFAAADQVAEEAQYSATAREILDSAAREFEKSRQYEY